MVWGISFDEYLLLNVDETGLRLSAPIAFDQKVLPKIFKPHFAFYGERMPENCECLLLRGSTGFKRMGEGRETPAQKQDYLSLIGYLADEIPQISDDLAQRINLTGDSFGELTEGAIYVRGALDNFQFDFTRGLYRAIQNAIKVSPALTFRDKAEIKRKTQPIKDLVWA